MEIKAGQRLACPACATELVVVRPPSAPVEVTCGGAAVGEPGDDRPGGGHADPGGDPTLVGKRYSDDESGLEVLCSKAGEGALACAGRPMPVKGAKPLPSSD